MSKQHVKGFVAAVLVAVASYLGLSLKHVYQVYKAVEVFSEVVAHDQKSGKDFNVADVLEAVAQDKVKELVAQQQQAAEQPKK